MGCLKLAIFIVIGWVLINVLSQCAQHSAQQTATKERARQEAALSEQRETIRQSAQTERDQGERRKAESAKKLAEAEKSYMQDVWLSPKSTIYHEPSDTAQIESTTDSSFTKGITGHANAGWYTLKNKDASAIGCVRASQACLQSEVGGLPDVLQIQHSLDSYFGRSKRYWGKSKITFDTSAVDGRKCWAVTQSYRIRKENGDYVESEVVVHVRNGETLTILPSVIR